MLFFVLYVPVDSWGTGVGWRINWTHSEVQSVSTHPIFLYWARDTEWEPFDELRILSYQSEPYDGPTGPGSYALEGSNYGDCGLCLLVVTGCDEEYSCESVHFADQGTLVISDLSRTGGPFTARLQEVVCRQVEIDPDTLRSTPIEDGVSWCIDELEIDLPSMALN